MKLCKDCKHLVRGLLWFDPEGWKCKTGLVTRKPSPLTGVPEDFTEAQLVYCAFKRKISWDPCGPKGDLWEPKGGRK